MPISLLLALCLATLVPNAWASNSLPIDGETPAAALQTPDASSSAELWLRIVDLDGQPIADAQAVVQLRALSTPPRYSKFFPHNLGSSASFSTTAQNRGGGDWVLEKIPPLRWVSLTVWGPHHRQQSFLLPALAPGEVRKLPPIVLQDGYEIKGQVQTENGSIPADAEVWLFPVQPALCSLDNPLRVLRHSTLDSQGRFSLQGLKADRYGLEVWRKDASPVWMTVEMNPLRSVQNLSITMKSGAELQGVVRSVHGQTIAGARVLVVPHGTSAKGAVGQQKSLYPMALAVDAEGGYTVHLVAQELPVAIWAGAPGYQSAAVEIFDLDQPVNFSLRPSNTLSGRVIDDQGQPLADTLVYLFPLNAAGPLQRAPQRIFTDAKGNFQFEFLKKGSYDCQLSSPSGIVQKRIEIQTGRPMEILLQTPPRSSRAILQFVTSGGTPVAGAWVSLSSDITQNHHSWPRVGRSDANGLIFLDGELLDQTLHISAYQPGLAFLQAQVLISAKDQGFGFEMPAAAHLKLSVSRKGQAFGRFSMNLIRHYQDGNTIERTFKASRFGNATIPNLFPGTYHLEMVDGPSSPDLKISFKLTAGQVLFRPIEF
jgi:Carboxypeptidase regulatory-like domain